MRFKSLENYMRSFERNQGEYVSPDMFIIARIDGRGFTKLTKKYEFEKPYDLTFNNYMVQTTRALMNCGFDAIYGYTQSDEISILFNKNTEAFNRKIRKFNSILAGTASAKFSTLLNDIATFDCRLSILPNKERVIDYFKWRLQDAVRNCINSYCYYILIKEGYNPRQASNELYRKNFSWKNEFLFNKGVNFNDVQDWKKQGIITYKKVESKTGFNPKLNEFVEVNRNSLLSEPLTYKGEAYVKFLKSIICNYDN